MCIFVCGGMFNPSQHTSITVEVRAADHPRTSLMIVISSLETTDGNLYLHIPMKMDLQQVTSALNLLKSTSVGFKTERGFLLSYRTGQTED